MATDEHLVPEQQHHITGKVWYSIYPKDMASAVVLKEGGIVSEQVSPFDVVPARIGGCDTIAV